MTILHQTISLYDKPNYINSKKKIPIDLFFEGIRDGKWQDEVIKVRRLPYKSDEQLQGKKEVTSVTISGDFEERRDDALIKHTGLVGIDLDDVEDINGTKTLLSNDPYVVSCFMSISGRGLCVVFRINSEKHKEAFQGILEYLYNTYKLTADPTSVNPSRARFVSWDPGIYVNDKALKFTKYPKEATPPKVEKIVYASDDFHFILQQIHDRKLNICENYHEWLRIGFAIADKYGEEGRQFYHEISQYSRKYDARQCDKQYNNCMKAKGKTRTTISTLYYYAKEAGCEVYSERTKKIIRATSNGRRAGLSVQDISRGLIEHEQINEPELIQQAWDGNVELAEDTLLDKLEGMLRQKYEFRRNEITRYIEDKGRPIEKVELNSIFIKSKKIFPQLNFDLMERLIYSDFVPNYNPFIEFFEQNKELEQPNCIEMLFGSIQSKDEDYVLHFGRKWLVGIISSIYGTHSPLMLVLSGSKQYTGKTEWFRRLLPTELKKYYAESKLDREKDDEILMTQKLIIMDDEMGGKSKKEDKRLKELTSKQVFSLREPYGRNNVDLNRLAVMCGTTNDNEILHDLTGNRRILPVHVFSINFEQYNAVSKGALLMEAHRLYMNNFPWQLTREDIEWLNEDAVSFEASSAEADLILKYFEPGETLLTSTEIKVYIEQKTNQRLSLDRIGKELRRLGFEPHSRRYGNAVRRVYGVKYVAIL